MYIQALVVVVIMGKILRALFFGQLRAAEMEVRFLSFLLITFLVFFHKYMSCVNN
jgi:hypothetical protein